jgi:hypothetical protein
LVRVDSSELLLVIGTTHAVVQVMRFPLILALAASCASTSATSRPTGGPRGLRASEHLDVARQHDASAESSSKWPDAYGDRAAYNIPWTRSWDTGKDQARLAAIHRSKAAELQAAYEEACGTRPLEQVSVSPLHRFAVGGWNTSTGVIMYLSLDAGAPDKLMADMKCHRAWMMLAPADMENCPLDLADIKLDARGDADGITVSIAISDPKLIDELQRRAAHEIEAAARH